MDQLATAWASFPNWILEGVSQARALPYPALHVIMVLIVLALLSRSLVAILLSLMLIAVAGTVLLADPADKQSWAIFWTVSAATVIATAVSFHRHRLARRIILLQHKIFDLKEELADLRPKYAREVMWRRASGSDVEHGGPPPEPASIPADPVIMRPAGGHLTPSWQAKHQLTP